MSAHSRKATVDDALTACATVKGDRIVRELGPGLYLAQNPSIPGTTVLRVTHRHAARREATVLRHLLAIDWPAAPRYCGRWHNESLACLRVEYASGASLRRKFSGHEPDWLFDPKAVFEVTRQLANQLRLLHAHHVVHLNIKPDTVLFDGESIKLIGWKRSRLTVEAQPRATRLSGSFCAPETGRGRTSADPKLDVWSFGATIFYIATAGAVLPADRALQLLSLPHMPLWFANLVNDACNSDPERRPTMAQLCDKYFSIKARPWPSSLVVQVDLDTATDDLDSSGDAQVSDDDTNGSNDASVELEHSPVRALPAKPKTRASPSPALRINCDQRFIVTRTRANSCISAPNVLEGPKLVRCLRFPSADAGLAARLPSADAGLAARLPE